MPPLALDMHSEAVTLFARDPLATSGRAGRGWRELVSVPLDSEDLARELDELRVAALVHGGKGAPVMLWLPPDQILVRRAKLKETLPERREEEARAELAADTVYDQSELAIAVSPPDEDGWTTMLATLNATVEEARVYARRWGLTPAAVSTHSEADAFGGTPPILRPRPRASRRAARAGGRLALRAGTGLGVAAAAAAAVWAAVTYIPPLLVAEPERLFTTAPAAPERPDPAAAGARDAAVGTLPAAGFLPPGALAGLPGAAAVSAGPVPESLRLEPPASILTYYRPAGLRQGEARPVALTVGAAPGASLPAAAGDAGAPLAGPPAPDHPPAPAGEPEAEGAAAITLAEAPADSPLPATPDPEPEPEPEPVASEEAPQEAPLPPARPGSETAETAPAPEAPEAEPAAGAASLAAVTPDPGAAGGAAGSTVPLVGDPDPFEPATPSTEAPAPPDPDSETRFAVLLAPTPPARPADLVPVEPVVVAAAPDLGTNRGSVASGTRRVAIDMNSASLVGIINADGGRRALVRLPGGEFKRLSRGDELEGWQVSMIGVDAMRLRQGSQEITLILVGR